MSYSGSAAEGVRFHRVMSRGMGLVTEYLASYPPEVKCSPAGVNTKC